MMTRQLLLCDNKQWRRWRRSRSTRTRMPRERRRSWRRRRRRSWRRWSRKRSSRSSSKQQNSSNSKHMKPLDVSCQLSAAKTRQSNNLNGAHAVSLPHLSPLSHSHRLACCDNNNSNNGNSNNSHILLEPRSHVCSSVANKSLLSKIE